MTLEKGEYQDMNLYRDGKQIKEKDATYKVSIPKSVESIGQLVLMGCTKLKSITVE